MGGKNKNLHWCQIQEHKLCVSCRLTKLYNTPYNKTDLHTIHDFCGLVYWVLWNIYSKIRKHKILLIKTTVNIRRREVKTQSASWYFTLALKVCGFNQGFSVKEKQKKCLWTPGLKWFDHVQRRDWICWTQDVEHGSTRQEVKGKERRGGYGESWCNREES